MRKKNVFGITLADVQKARDEIRKYLPPSPLLYNPWLSEAYGCEIHLKLETMQPIGSFKIRGATYKISCLTPEEKKRGVIAASAGNHAQGVAWGSKKLGVKATIVMPKTAPLVKVKNTQSLGAEVILEGDSYDEAFRFAQKLARKSGKVYVHAFDDAQVVAGQATVGLELLEQLSDLDMVVSAIGGGGLLGGIAVVMEELRPGVQLIGAQAAGSPSMAQSFKKGRPVLLDRVETFADGIAVAQTRPSMYKLLRPRVDRILTADDEEIATAILTLLEKARLVAEGASAVSLAVLDQLKKKIRGKKVVLIMGGGNIDVNVLNRVIDVGLVQQGRRLRVNVLITDKPGSLARLTAAIAKEGANIIQAIHDRSEPGTRIDQTDVALTLETRGVAHGKTVIQALKNEGFAVHLV